MTLLSESRALVTKTLQLWRRRCVVHPVLDHPLESHLEVGEHEFQGLGPLGVRVERQLDGVIVHLLGTISESNVDVGNDQMDASHSD